ncbi:hypothetical protein LJC55_03540, partial [Eubacteriales bacterium OttesenSCG-928-N14]|nr:hypothetical protein [Eubacteriales bacterium OttesenSCG-928-N14]
VQYAYADDVGIHMSVSLQDTGNVFASHAYRIEDGAAYVKLYQILPTFTSNTQHMAFTIPGNYADLTAIYLEDKDKTLLVWKHGE